MTENSAGSVVTLAIYALAAVILFVGAAVRIRQDRRERGKPMTEEEALEGLRNLLSDGLFRWVALAAVALLLPRLWRSSGMPGWETVWTIFLLGLAGERAQYIVSRWSHSTRYRAWVAAALVIAGGLAVGLTS